MSSVPTLAALLGNLAFLVLSPVYPEVREEVDVIRLRRPPASSECTMPYAGSLVTDRDSAAYLQMCSRVRSGYPTTLNVIEFETGRRVRTSYQLSVIKPKLLSIDGRRVTWLEIGPDRKLHAGNQVELVEFDLVSGQTVRRDRTSLPFDGWLMQVSRGEGCTLVRAEKGLKEAALIVVNSGRLRLAPADSAERVLFWDAPTAGFVLSKGTATEGRAIDCEGRAVPLAPAAQTMVSTPRHKLDRFFSAAPARAIAIEPLERGAQARLLVAENGGGRSAYRTKLDVDAIHGLAASVSGDRIAVLGRRSIEIIGPGAARRSVDISQATGWNTQAAFLEGRPVLVVLDDLGVSTFDMEH